MVFRLNQLKKLPYTPGVYQFFDKRGDLLYAGKARVLKNRISSYFREGGDGRPMIGQMVKQIDRIEILETESEIDALILESDLINKLMPKYNIKLRDDKSFLMVKITKEEIPKILFVRYKDYLEEIHGRHPEPRIVVRGRPVSGSHQKKEMLKQVQHDKKIVKGKFFGPYTSGYSLKKAFNILRKIFRFADCSTNKYRSYVKKGQPCLYGMIKTCQAPCADTFIRQDYLKEIGYLKMFLRGKKKQLIKTFESEMAGQAKSQNYEKAADLRDKIEALKHLNQAAAIFSDYNSESLNIKRIEAYDIANISGQLSVGSMVVAENGEINKNEYRKFKIKTVFGANDVAMIGEILARRFKNNWPKPDLIVIDGGLGQYRVAKNILYKLNIPTRLLSIAKGRDRKKDEFIYEDPELAKSLKKDDNLVRLIKHLRDEAHRFAQGYFHVLQVKKLRR